MSKKSLLVVLVVLAGALTLSVTGQEEPTSQPLPVVQAKVASFGLIDPAVDFQWPTLAEAARQHDYVSFNTVYLEAKARGESVAQFDALYELWTWSMNDPIGAFYGREMHDRIARAYPGFTSYIADFAIVDRRGNTFYPTSETRMFLLDRAVAGTPSPRLMIAEATRPAPVASVREEKPLTRRSAAPSPRRAGRVETKVAAPAEAAPVVATPAAVPAPVTAAAPAPEPVVTEPPVVVRAEAPAPAAAPAPTPVQATEPETSGLPNRGILLIVIGLIGIGLLALILRTPKETMPATILTTTPPAADKPPAPVEPIRRTPAPGSVKAEEKPRATGSHG